MFKDKLLENKTIVITGGGSGLGKSMARRFGELGANIVISGRRKEVLEETAHDFSEKNINVLTCPGDVRKVEDVEVMSKQTLDKFGTVDALLNNAAGNFISPTEMLSQNAFKAVIDIVLMGTWNCTSVLGKEMIKNKKREYSQYSDYIRLDWITICSSFSSCKGRGFGNDKIFGS